MAAVKIAWAVSDLSEKLVYEPGIFGRYLRRGFAVMNGIKDVYYSYEM